ncbi:hypothetical protein N7534_008183 [Penicillium rubens]|nr:hypothetical protein N7534_008183 [Penicillium rubens]
MILLRGRNPGLRNCDFESEISHGARAKHPIGQSLAALPNNRCRCWPPGTILSAWPSPITGHKIQNGTEMSHSTNPAANMGPPEEATSSDSKS